LLVPEEVLPPPRLRGVRPEHDDGRNGHEPEVRVMQRPPRKREVARDESSHDRCHADQRDVEEPLQLFQLPGHRPVCAYVAPGFPPDRASNRSATPPSACVSSLGITHTLFASPCAICGRTCRYW